MIRKLKVVLSLNEFMETKITIDMIILSYAQNEELQQMTQNCIDSLLASEDAENIKFNIVIVESQKTLKPYQYKNATTIYPDQPFTYNRYMNIGIQMTSAPYICICNNDLIFYPQWATEILNEFSKYYDLDSASPFDPVHHEQMGFKKNNGIYPGYRIRYELAGWCIFFKRELLNRTGQLDENLEFWGSDNDYGNTLFVLNIAHALVSSSIVEHLESRTLIKQPKERREELMVEEIPYYNKKWNPRLGINWKVYNG